MIFSPALQSMHEMMSQDCTDEAGKVKSSNPFIEEPNQSNTVVDMKGKSIIDRLYHKADD
jgi:voltage-gated sodium channel type II alpha